MLETTTPATNGLLHNRWLQLIVGVICMAMIANLQYGWTLFVNPIDTKYHWGIPAIQVAFSIFVFTETWLVPVEAWFVDRYGPRSVIVFGGVLVTLAWLVNSQADSLALLYVGALLGGIGAGAVYGTCVGNALKWFPGRRGLAAGCTAAGFGAGAALTVAPIAQMITAQGYQAAFMVFGIAQGVIILVMSLLLRKAPLASAAVKPRANQTARDFRPAQVLRHPVFWVLYLAFVLVASGGLIAAASLAPIAKDFQIAGVPVSILGLTGTTLTLALQLDRILDGFGRPFFGWVSDKIGRENTMFIAFGIGAIALLSLSTYGRDPIVFVLVSALFFLVFGEIYSLFPATSGDTFGSSFAATNAGMLYTAKGTASLTVPIAGAIAVAHGWPSVFMISMSFNIAAAVLVLFVLKPMRVKLFRDSRLPLSGYEAASRPIGAAAEH
jgi:OFA family oxalate/formate antiporter-like MFS transporter